MKQGPKHLLICMVKTPYYSPVKTRLARNIGIDHAINLYVHCLSIIKVMALDLISNFRDNGQWEMVWAIAEKEGVGHKLWSDFSTIIQRGQNLAERMHNAYLWGINGGFNTVTLIGGDCPLLISKFLDRIAYRCNLKRCFYIGPTRDGGFYLFTGHKFLPKEFWTNVTYSTSHTYNEFLDALRPYGSIGENLPFLADFDQIADLKVILGYLKKSSDEILGLNKKCNWTQEQYIWIELANRILKNFN